MKIQITTALDLLNIPHNGREFSAIWRKETTPSCRISAKGDKFVDFGDEKEFASDAIDLVGLVKNCGYKEADAFLGTQKKSVREICPTAHTPEKCYIAPNGPSVRELTTSADISVSVKPIAHRALIQYAKSRGISQRILQRHTRQVEYNVRGREFFTIGIENLAGGWATRNSLTMGKRTLGKSGISIIQKPFAENLAIVEGLFDALSFLELWPNITADILILNGTGMVVPAKKWLANTNYKKISYFGDNGKGGDKAMKYFSAQYFEKRMAPIIDKRSLLNGHKDLNDLLISKMK